MKSLNDIIWREDIDLEEEKDNIGTLGMQQICLEQSCKPTGRSPIAPKATCEV